MRLGQLAREKGLSTLDVRDALVKEFDLNIDRGPNTKLEEEHIEFIHANFKEEVIEVPVVEEEKVETADELLAALDAAIGNVPVVKVTPEVKAEPEVAVEEGLETVAEEVFEENGEDFTQEVELPSIDEVEQDPENVIVEEVVDISDKQVLTVAEIEAAAEQKELTDSETQSENGEEEETAPLSYENMPISEREKAPLIKAPKVEIAGFKVVDKIDLPEPKVKEVVTEEGSEASDDDKPSVKKERKPRAPRKQSHTPSAEKKQEVTPKKKKKNPKSGPSKRQLQNAKMQAKYKAKEKAARGKKKKEIKKQEVAVQVKEETAQVAKEQAVTEVVKQKTGFAKFWHWLNNG